MTLTKIHSISSYIEVIEWGRKGFLPIFAIRDRIGDNPISLITLSEVV